MLAQQPYILLVAIASLPLTSAVPRYFLGRYNGMTRRDYIFDVMLGLPPLLERPAYDEKVCANDKSEVKINWFKQPLDHFDSTNKQTWGQVMES
jgi:hypothetical protein